jgi:predicted ABC-type ATPase
MPDVYGENGMRYYGASDGTEASKRLETEMKKVLAKARGNPDADITIYRAVPKGTDVINAKDWVTPVKEYAETHGEGPLGGNYRIVSRKAKASDLFSSGDSLFEYGWDPLNPPKKGGLRSSRPEPLPQRINRAYVDEILANQTPEENLKTLEDVLNEFGAFVDEHHRVNFESLHATDTSGDLDNDYNEYIRLKSNVEKVLELFEDQRDLSQYAEIRREEIMADMKSLINEIEKGSLSHGPDQAKGRRVVAKAIRDGLTRDAAYKERGGAYGTSEWNAMWDEVNVMTVELARLNGELKEYPPNARSYQNGTPQVLQEVEKIFASKFKNPGTRFAQTSLSIETLSLAPGEGLRSRRDSLSPLNKEWLKLLQSNPGYWDDVPAAVRGVASDKIRKEAAATRPTGINRSIGMRSGGRQAGSNILGKVKPEHRQKETRTLYFIGGTTGAGKSTLIGDGRMEIPGDTEAAHIDPDYIKTQLNGWDPKNPSIVHAESRVITDRVMQDAMNGQMDMVVQGTGKRTEHLQAARRQGYFTVGHFVWVPDKEADRRIAQRTQQGGSNIPGHFGSLIAAELRHGIVSRQITTGLYSEFYLWDNTGKVPVLIAYRNKDGRYEIFGREEFDSFFGTGGKYVEKYWSSSAPVSRY